MRNKGAIWVLAIALALVSIYQLSFTFKSSAIKKNAREWAGQDPSRSEQHYLDSIAGEEVYNFLFGVKKYTFRECQEREINLGLDLKGGMNVILEVSVEDVIRSLANYSKDTTFNRAIALAKEWQKSSQDEFVNLFGRAFTEIDPNAKLAAVFTTVELRDKVEFNSTNEEVLAVLKEETSDAIQNSFNIIRTRIDHFGVTQPNVQRLEGNDRILVELPGVKERDRVKNLLQGTANLEFWEAYETSEVGEGLMATNTMIRDLLAAERELRKSQVEEEEQTPDLNVENKAVKETTGDEFDDLLGEEAETPSLLDELESDSSLAGADTLQESLVNDYPLFQWLYPALDQENRFLPGPVLGRARKIDTAKVGYYLRMAMEKGLFPRDFKYFWTAKPMPDPENNRPTEIYELIAIKITGRNGKAPLSGDVVTDAREEFDENSATARVSMSMNAEGTKKWARITKENVGRYVCVVMDNLVYSFARVNEEITAGNTQITGNFTIREAQDLANLLKSGSLPAPARIVQEEVIGPSLGKEAIQSGLKSFLIAFLVILLYMVFYYSRRGGMVADIALLVNMFFITGVLASLQAVLTLPGIAGIVLTIGMSVDANVLIYERIREEVSAGKGIKLAIADGYKNAYSAIIDSNLTTGLTGVILLLVGTGPIKGFATTLVIGICTSLFSAIFITRLVFEWFLQKHAVITFDTSITRNAFKKVNFGFLDKRRTFQMFSLIIILVGVGSLIIRGLDPGVDFTGGRNYRVRFHHEVSTMEIANSLESVLGETPKVIRYGQENDVRITTRYKIDDEDPNIDNEIQNLLYTGLKPYMEDTLSYEGFASDYIKGNQKVGPTIADDIKKQAIIAIVFSLIIMFLYILIRFRNWQYGLGAVAALIHDSLIVLGIFSLLWGKLNFSLEIDQAFIAAILTVVGYSINDTVVIFDRIREYIGLYPKRERKEIMNMALNSTISRTFNTSMSTFVVLLTIFIFGGEVIRGFIFALLIGIVVGTYSSLFVATPIVYDTIKKVEKKQALKMKK